MNATVTLLTDFGAKDPYAGVVKGVMRKICPEITVIDLSHEITSFSILQAAFLISTVYRYFPIWTIHLAVVDPGVGGARRPLIVSTDEFYFVGPDNGIFTYIYEENPDCVVREITESHYFLESRGATFHARDVFAPAAAWLARSPDASLFGDVIKDFVKLPVPRPYREQRRLRGEVLHVDSFGNLISNINQEILKESVELFGAPPVLSIGGRHRIPVRTAYCEEAPQAAVALVGGTGYLEIAINQGNASETLGCGIGAGVTIDFEKGGAA